jgi:TP901 family phage tail tape measure protein
MAIKLFELGYVVRAIDKASGVFKNITSHIEAMEGATKLAFGVGLDQMAEKIGAGGEKLKGFLETSFDIAADTQSKIASLSAAVPGWSKDQLDAAQEMAEKFSSAHLGGVDDFLASMQALAPIFKTVPASADAASKALELHTVTGISAAGAVELLNQAYLTFNDTASATAGQIAATKQLFGLPNVEGISSALGRLSGAARAAGADSAETFGVLARMQQILGEGAGRAAMAFSEAVVHANKYGLDSTHGLVNMLDQVRVKLDTMGHAGQIDFMSKVFGASAGMRLLPMIEGTRELSDKIAKIRSNAGGALGGMLDKTESAPNAKIAILHQQVQLLEETLGSKLLPMVNKVVDKFGAFIDRITGFAKANPGLTKFLVITTAAVAGMMLLASWILPVIGSIAMLGAGALATAAWVALIGVGIAAATAAIIAWWPQIKSFFTKQIPAAFEWGVSLLKEFGRGIEAAALWPIHALEGVLKRMRGFLPFSPAKEGPLRDLHRVRIVETIAASMRPAALGAAMTRVGMAAMVAAPLMFGSGAGTASAAASGGAGISVTVYQTVKVSGGDSRQLIAALRSHNSELARSLVDEVQREMARRERSQY